VGGSKRAYNKSKMADGCYLNRKLSYCRWTEQRDMSVVILADVTTVQKIAFGKACNR